MQQGRWGPTSGQQVDRARLLHPLEQGLEERAAEQVLYVVCLRICHRDILRVASSCLAQPGGDVRHARLQERTAAPPHKRPSCVNQLGLIEDAPAPRESMSFLRSAWSDTSRLYTSCCTERVTWPAEAELGVLQPAYLLLSFSLSHGAQASALQAMPLGEWRSPDILVRGLGSSGWKHAALTRWEACGSQHLMWPDLPKAVRPLQLSVHIVCLLTRNASPASKKQIRNLTFAGHPWDSARPTSTAA